MYLFEVITDKKLLVIFRPEIFEALRQRLQFIEANKSSQHGLTSARHTSFKLFTNIDKVTNGECMLNKLQLHESLLKTWTSGPTTCYSNGARRAACWISLDVYMENVMDWKNLQAISAIEVLTGACHYKDYYLMILIFQSISFFFV